ncbi:hypothetical protein G5B35_00160 [Parapusillimonas sp. SGNA-6]|nr:hypothetical protein [Parapusillimonas sp. SGNA-6]
MLNTGPRSRGASCGAAPEIVNAGRGFSDGDGGGTVTVWAGELLLGFRCRTTLGRTKTGSAGGSAGGDLTAGSADGLAAGSVNGLAAGSVNGLAAGAAGRSAGHSGAGLTGAR